MAVNDLDELRRRIAGDVLVPGDEHYDEARNVFVHQGSPEVIVRCRGADDVRAAIAHARRHDLVLTVRSGGHSNAGWSTHDAGLVVDLAGLDAVEVLDAALGLVRIGPGAQWGAVAEALAPHGLAVSSGDTSTVAAGGLLLGGGIGWMVRRDGLAIDNVVSVEVVTADGELVVADAEREPELFWGLRGGSGNLGVATSFVVRAHPVGHVHFGTVSFPADEADTVAKAWAETMRDAPETVTTILGVFPPFDGVPTPVLLTVCVAEDDPARADRLVEPFRRLGTVLESEIKSVPYPEVLVPPGPLPPEWQPMVRSGFVETVTPALVDTVLTRAADVPMLYVEFRSMGGAVDRVAPEATAFAHRGHEAMVMTVHLASPEEHVGVQVDYDELWAAADEHVAGPYTGFVSQQHWDADTLYTPATAARLRALKKLWDPQNVFSRNPNVPPDDC